jgi:hypothetical protein
MIQIALASLLALGFTPQAQSSEIQSPPMPQWQTDAQRCRWQWREGGGLGLWAETCRLSTGRWQVVWSEPRRAFVLQRDRVVVAVVVQSWPLPSGQDMDAVSQALTEAGHLAVGAPCRWKAVPMRPAPRTMAFYVLSPQDPGALGPTALGEVPDPVCGPYGASTHGVRYFIVDLRWTGRAIFVNEGQERPMFDPLSVAVLR